MPTDYPSSPIVAHTTSNSRYANFRLALLLFVSAFLLLMPAFYASEEFSVTDFSSWGMLLKELLLSFIFFLIPLVLFYRNIKVYLYLLIPFVLLSPTLIFFILYYGIRPRFELIALVMQTNPTEIKEATAGYLQYFLPISLACLLLYFFSVRKMPHLRISFVKALSISFLAGFITIGAIILEKALYHNSFRKLNKYSLLIVNHYPLSLAGGSLEAYSELAKTKLRVPADFSFGAIKQDTLAQRQIYLLVIGESSRYDHWQLNGYQRPTSPLLLLQEKLISYNHVVAGSYLTWMSVPQMITRANPDSIDLQYTEKSILTAFKEAGFKTAWLSNQSDQEILWSGTILNHARTADVVSFSPAFSPNLELDQVHDLHLLQSLDSLIQADNQDLFIVLHTMGNHWIYDRRYPAAFDVFTPSGSTVAISPPTAAGKEAIINSYDNSIRYADYIIDSAINTVKRAGTVSSVLFLSDHGDDLFDASPENVLFHLYGSQTTLHVPLFIWTSSQYDMVYPAKRELLEAHRDRKIGPENTFHTLLDLANIRISKQDSTRSLVSPHFSDSQQKYWDNNSRRALYYHNLHVQQADTVLAVNKAVSDI